MDTKGHLINQPGLRAHSVDPDNNLMKRYVVAYHPHGGIGWIWETSFDTMLFAHQYVNHGQGWEDTTAFQIIDTKIDKVVVTGTVN